MRRMLVHASLALSVVVAGAATATTAPADGSAGTSGAVEAVGVGTDAVGDWGGGGDGAAAGHVLGQDLLSASIGMPSKDEVEFVLEVTFLPSSGGIPEASRYTWNFLVGGKPFELDGKFTNYSRGACDPTSGQCPPPRDPGQAPFLLRGDCAVNDANVTLCKELGRFQARFDPAARTITVPVPSSSLGIAPCAVISGGTNLFGGSVSAAPSAFFTTSAAPLDTMELDGTFRVPSADPVGAPCV